jgi:hypothetical protein
MQEHFAFSLREASGPRLFAPLLHAGWTVAMHNAKPMTINADSDSFIRTRRQCGPDLPCEKTSTDNGGTSGVSTIILFRAEAILDA